MSVLLILAVSNGSPQAQASSSQERRNTTVLQPLPERQETPESTTQAAELARELVESDVVLRRRGAGRVESVGIGGLTWVTLEGVDATIRIRPAEEGRLLRRLPSESWGALTDTLSLAGAVASAPPVPYVDIPTARRGAAGTVLAVSDALGDMVLRITGSTATVSDEGTTVVLIGRVRR